MIPRLLACPLLLLALSGCNGLSSVANTTTGYFPSGEDQLYYAFDVPKSGGPFPVVIMGHGSGRETAADNAGRSARWLEHGVAVFRYDKRGVGKSEGVYSKAFSSLPVLAGDMVAAVDFIKSHPQVDSTRIGLMGVSQAGWIIPIAASRSTDVDFTVILVGPTVTAMQANYFDEQADDESLSMDSLSTRLRSFSTAPGDFDPRPYLEQLSVPGLWIFGQEDRIIPARESAAILDALIETRQKPFTVISYPGMGHGLRGSPDYWFDVLAGFDENIESHTLDALDQRGQRPPAR